MKALLTQIALILGGVVAAISLAWNLAQRMDLLTSVFRATLVFFATVMVLFIFLRFFSVILVRFVAEQVLQNRPPENPEDGSSEKGTPAKAGPGALPRNPGSVT